jgi:xylulose-5-phosphate/fructose-6-phosphate phosphoketolase
MTTKQFSEMVNHKSGLLGVSQLSSDMRDDPGLIVACVVGDGEAETGPLATACQPTI